MKAHDYGFPTVIAELLGIFDVEAASDWLITPQFTLSNRTPIRALLDGDVEEVLACVS
jgi:uncharacterized protein (DUF2384 family)